MPTYAKETSVSCEASRNAIERTLMRYGAQNFIYATMQDKAIIGFTSEEGFQIKFVLPLPDKADREFTHTPSRGTLRSADQVTKAWEQACRQRWAALHLVVKAKLEAVESGISEFVQEFMPHIVLPNGDTAAEYMVPKIVEAYQSGAMPPMLPVWGASQRIEGQ